MPHRYLLPLDSPDATLALAGGKGANLSRLLRGGFTVPGGFIITTAGYDAFVAANGLTTFIRDTLATGPRGLNAADPDALEEASAAIRGRFTQGAMPPAVAAEIAAVYCEALPGGAVAVRSSATAEDLPDLSFAGQQDTFLNVQGTEAVLAAVSECWASLWTARAIGYRARNGIGQEGLSLAVVVQAMVDAEAAGVLFTADPVTGRRTETVIDAVRGLGEALVSGRVTPEHWIVREGRVEGLSPNPALLQATILALAETGKQIERYFGGPQDVEWAWDGGTMWIVQARPITSLYPLPEGWDPAGELRVLASAGAFQGMLDPWTPLGQDLMRSVGARIGSYFGYTYTFENVPGVQVAGERLYLDLTALLRNGFGRRLVRAALSQVEPGTGAALARVLEDPRLPVTAERPSPARMRSLLPVLLPLAARFAATLLRPEANRQAAQRDLEVGVAHFARQAEATRSLSQRLDLLDGVAVMLRRFMFVTLLPRLAPGMASLYQLYRLADLTPQGRMLALEITRGLPHNVTTEMDLALWQLSRRIHADAASMEAFRDRDSHSLAADWLARRLPPPAQAELDRFLDRYGMRGLAEIDLGRPRWREDPAPVIDAVRSYLQITDSAQAPDAVFERGARAAGEAVERLAGQLRRRPGGWLLAHRARFFARRVRALAGLRESPKFTIVRVMGLVRAALLRSGEELVAAGALDRPDDILYVPLATLRTLTALPGGAPPPDLRPVVVAQRERYEREKRRPRSPRVLLSDGQAFYEGVSAASESEDGKNVLRGSPVSPGTVEGTVHVVLDPRGANLLPGEILVCPGTDPSWTPLFLAAGGLVMEVGGLMTHGSVVAREYGIPAVVGVHEVTTRLRTGQRVRVDGSKGVVTILSDDS